MDQADFWRLIDVLQGQNEPAAIERLVGGLTVLPDRELEAFSTCLAKAVHDLDTEIHSSQPIDTDDFEPGDVDEDLFVSVRCAVVTAGRAAYERVHGDPSELARRHDWPIADGESILQAADTAYERRTGQTWTFSPEWETETGENLAGWPSLDPPEPPSGDSGEPSAWIQVDFHFDDSHIGDLEDDPSWWVPTATAVHETAQRFSRDPSLQQRYADLGVTTVSITVHFLERTGRAPRRVKRRGTDVEIALGRHLDAEVVVSQELHRWMDEYLRDSLDLGLERLAR